MVIFDIYTIMQLVIDYQTMMPYHYIVLYALPVKCGVPPHMQLTCHDLPVNSGPAPGAHEPKLMSSSCFFSSGHQASNVDSFIMCVSFLRSQSYSGWQSNHQVIQQQLIESATIIYDQKKLQGLYRHGLFSGIGLQSRRRSRALFDTEALGKPTCHTLL